MSDELRALRLDLQLPAKDIVAVVQTLYPKYDKTMQSKCERGSEYGVDLRPDAMKALYERFAPERLQARRAKKDDGHRLTHRISARLEDEDYEALQLNMEADGYATAQEWITAMVREYNRQKGGQGNV